MQKQAIYIVSYDDEVVYTGDRGGAREYILHGFRLRRRVAVRRESAPVC